MKVWIKPEIEELKLTDTMCHEREYEKPSGCVNTNPYDGNQYKSSGYKSSGYKSSGRRGGRRRRGGC